MPQSDGECPCFVQQFDSKLSLRRGNLNCASLIPDPACAPSDAEVDAQSRGGSLVQWSQSRMRSKEPASDTNTTRAFDNCIPGADTDSAMANGCCGLGMK